MFTHTITNKIHNSYFNLPFINSKQFLINNSQNSRTNIQQSWYQVINYVFCLIRAKLNHCKFLFPSPVFGFLNLHSVIFYRPYDIAESCHEVRRNSTECIDTILAAFKDHSFTNTRLPKLLVLYKIYVGHNN